MITKLARKNILGIDITDGSVEDVLEYLFNNVIKNGEKCAVFTPNPEIFMYAQRHEAFKNKLNSACVLLCDGVGLLWASRVLKNAIKTRITGVAMVEELCKESVRRGATVGFLGGRGDVALKTAECLSKKYPGLKIAFVGEEWLRDNKQDTKQNRAGLKEKLFNSKHLAQKQQIDILFVAFGFPKQEEWIYENLPHIPVTIAMGVGGAFDYISGKVTRAPRFLQKIGLEWVFRLIRQPWRIKRQLVLIQFVWVILRARIISKTDIR